MRNTYALYPSTTASPSPTAAGHTRIKQVEENTTKRQGGRMVDMSAADYLGVQNVHERVPTRGNVLRKEEGNKSWECSRARRAFLVGQRTTSASEVVVRV